MGYNGGNRRMRSSMFSKRAARQGSKALGNMFTGLLGAGAVVGREIGKAMEENAKNIQIEKKPKPKAIKPTKDANGKRQEKKKSLTEWVELILLVLCGIAIFVVAAYYIGRLAIGLLVGLALFSKK